MKSVRAGAAYLIAGMVVTGIAGAQPRPCVRDTSGMPLVYGDRVTCEVRLAGEMNVFRFPGTAGESVLIQVTRTSGSAWPSFELLDPDKTQIISSLGTAIARRESRLTKSGDFTLRVLAYGNVETFAYELLLLRTVPTPNPVRLRFLEPVDGSIDFAGDIKFYEVAGQAGDSLAVQVTRVAGSAWPLFELRDPGQTLLGAPLGTAVARAEYRLSKTGTYTIRVLAYGNAETMRYTVLAQCIGVCPSEPPVVSPACQYALSPASQLLSSGAASGSVGVLTSAGCPWSASSAAAHITITSGATGTGPGTVRYAVTANSTPAARTGTLTIAGLTASITQSGSAPLLVVSPTPLAFGYRQGGAAPPGQVLTIYTNAPSLSFTAGTGAGASWLSVNPRQGSAPAGLTVSVDASGLAPGNYTGNVVLSAPAANPPSQNVPVSLIVEPAGAPKLSVEPGVLAFSLNRGAAPRTEHRTVANSGGGTLFFQVRAATNDGQPWLRAAADRNDATLAAPASLAITVDPAGLSSGTYTGRVIVDSPAVGERQELPVAVTVSALPQSLLLSQTGLTFTAVAGGSSVLPQTFGVLNAGQGLLRWSASAATISGGPGWLTIQPAGGSTDPASLVVPMVEVGVNASSLAQGDYYGQIRVDAPGADNSPQFLGVVLTVLPAGSDPGPEVRPTGLIFTGAVGGTQPVAQTVLLSSPTAVSRAYVSGRLTVDGAAWLASQPATGSLQPGRPSTVQVQVTNAGLAAGVRRGVLTLLFQDGAVRAVNVLSVLVGSGAAQAGAARAADTVCTPTRLLPLISSLGSNFQVAASWPTPLEVRVVDDCGTPMTDGSVVASFSNSDPPLPLVSLKNGLWTGTWQARNAKSPQVTVEVTAEMPARNLHGVAQLSGGLRANQDPPVVGAGAVVSAASFSSDAPPAPGSMLAIFGARLAQGQSSSERLPLEMRLAGATAALAGKPMPLLFASEGQINAIVPYGIAVNTRHQLIIRRGDSYALPESLLVAAAQPAIYTKDMSGKGQGIILNAQGQLAEPGTPAAPGEVITVYCAGLGEVDPLVDAGAPAPASPLAWTANPVVLKIGGLDAKVLFSGLTPAATGLYQVNALVPEGVSVSDALPVVLVAGGQSSGVVTMAVRGAATQ
jgi:uncharacterized protein (TIGR03437 family)